MIKSPRLAGKSILFIMTSYVEKCYMIFDWLDVFPEPIKLRVTSHMLGLLFQCNLINLEFD